MEGESVSLQYTKAGTLIQGFHMAHHLMSYSAITLLTSFKALLQTSYFGESLGVF
jgi:hypothetical protein